MNYYLAGLYLADGTVSAYRKKITEQGYTTTIVFEQKDEQLVQGIADLYDRKVTSRVRNDKRGFSSKSYIVSLPGFLSEEIVNLIGKKPKIEEFWKCLTEEQNLEIARGFFDGDGCISFVEKGKGVQLSFYCPDPVVGDFVKYFLKSRNIFFIENSDHGKYPVFQVLRKSEADKLVSLFLQVDGLTLERKTERMRIWAGRSK